MEPVLLVHFNGPDAQKSYTAETGQTLSFGGDTQLDTAQAKFGSASCLYDGSADTITVPHSADWYFDGDFTIDFWVRWNAVPTSGNFQGFAGQSDNADNMHRWLFFLQGNAATQTLRFYAVGGSGTITVNEASPIAYSTGQWYHLAIVRYGSVFTLYRDGTGIGTATTAATFQDLTSTLDIGFLRDTGATNHYLNGWLDEVRILKGEAAWTTDFTPPTEEYVLTLHKSVSDTGTGADADPVIDVAASQSDTGSGVDNLSALNAVLAVSDVNLVDADLLLHCDGTDGSAVFTDSSPNNFSITAGAGARVRTAQFVFGGASLLLSGFNVNRHISAPDNDLWNFGSGDFTIDLRVRFSSLPAAGVVNQIIGQTVNSWIDWWLGFDGTNGIRFYSRFWIGTAQEIFFSQGSTTGWAINTWYHVALVRNGNNFNIYRDGVSVASTTSTKLMGDVAGPLYVGNNSGAFNGGMYGYVDEARIRKGIAVWTTAFTIPTEAYGPTSNGVETVSIQGAASASDTGAGADAVPAIDVTLPVLSESSVGAEAVQAINTQIPINDTGSGAEALVNVEGQDTYFDEASLVEMYFDA